jgi:hypothetical protein
VLLEAHFFWLEWADYSALKMDRINGSVIKKNGKGKQVLIQNSQTMRGELHRLQFITAETLLNILRSEIRTLELQAATPAIHIQIGDLHWQEYGLLERIKKENIAIAELEPVQPFHNMAFMQAQVAILEDELVVLAKLDHIPNIKDHVQSIQAEKAEWAWVIFDFGVLTLKQNLPSFNTNLVFYENQTDLETEMLSICNDFDTISRMKTSPELDRVEKELHEKQARLEKNWQILEERRINSRMRYDWADIQKIDRPGIIRAIRLINQDLVWLNHQKTNYIIDEHAQQLFKLRKELEGWQNNIDRQAAWPAPGGLAGTAGVLTGTGIGTVVSTLRDRFSPVPDQKDSEIPAVVEITPGDLPPASTKPSQWIRGIFVLMLFPAVITSVFFIAGMFIPGTTGLNNITALSFTLIGQAIGVVLGCIGFFLSIVPGASIWPGRVRQVVQVMSRSGEPLPRFRQYGTGFKLIVIVLAGLAVVFNSFFVMIVISSWFNHIQPAIVCITPVIALAIFVFVVMQKMKPPI